jgi:hypothetical protein
MRSRIGDDGVGIDGMTYKSLKYSRIGVPGTAICIALARPS